MNINRLLKRPLSLPTMLVALFSLMTVCAGAGQIVVEGYITSPDNKPIEGVSVRAESNGRPVGSSVQSDPNGYYVLKVHGATPFDVIYDHSAFHPDTFVRLSMERNHTINKVLYQPGSEQDYRPEVTLNILNAYEYIYCIDFSKEGTFNPKERFGSRLSKISTLKETGPLSILLEERKREVFKLYGVGQ